MKCKDKVKKTVFKIPSEMKYIREISSKVLDALEPCNIDESKLFDIRLCIEEAVRNAIVHGNRGDKNLSVNIAYWVDGEKFIIEIEDQGTGFDYKKLPDPTAGDNLLRNNGRGVYLMLRLMNEIEFNKTGNKVRMTKYLA